MAGGKTTPRQKMINMMYLVLTALLALNVSKEIIKAFNLIENSLITSTSNIKAKNDMARKAIAKEENESAKAAGKYADEAKKIADQFEKNIDGIKADLEVLAEGRKKDAESMLVKGGVAELVQGDNMEVHANYFLLEKGATRKDGKQWGFNPSGKMRGDAVMSMINSTRDDLLKVLDAAIKDPNLGGKDDNGETKKLLEESKKSLFEKTALRAENGKKSDGGEGGWVSMYLENSPLAGVFALLSKYTNDARSLESEITATLAKAVNASDFKFDKLAAVISAPSSAIMQGQTYEADIMLAAYNSKAQMNITANGAPVEIKDGIGKYKSTGVTPGEMSYKVNITVPGPGGKTENLTAEAKYSVFPPMAAISADELNVFYVNLENPLSVAVAGVDPKNISVNVSAGNLQRRPDGKYNVLIPVRTANESIVTVTAKMGDGRVMNMGSKKFKIRNVPSPIFKVGAMSFSGPVDLAQLKAQDIASAALDNFVYESVKYTLKSFVFTSVNSKKEMVDITCYGSSLAPIKANLSTLRSGNIISFSQIQAVGPGGVVKFLEGVSAKIK